MIGLHIGIDLGTSYTRIFVEGKGIVFSEPSVVVCDSHTGKPVAIGNDAMNMLGRIPGSLKIIYPVADGIISDFDMAVFFISHIIEKICRYKFFKPNIILSVRANMTGLERRSFTDVLSLADASRIFLVEEPLAAALGANIKSDVPKGSIIVDIGGGSVDVAVVSMNSIAVSLSIKTAGIAITDNIRQYLLRKHNLEVGFNSAEHLKKTIGGAIFREPEIALICNGKDYTTGLPRSIEVTSSEIYWVIKDQVTLITDNVHEIIKQTDPELIKDIKSEGIVLTGGGALLFGLETFIQQKLGIEARLPLKPENCVINGLGKALKDMERLYRSGYLYSFSRFT